MNHIILRVATSFQVSRLERSFQEIVRTLEPLQQNPGHAGAIFNGIPKVLDFLNLVEESGVPRQNDRLARNVNGARVYWRQQYAKLRTLDGEALKEVGKSLTFIEEVFERMVARVKEGLADEPDTLSVGKTEVRNQTGWSLSALGDIQTVLQAVGRALSHRQMSKLSEGSLVLVRRDQMPPSLGHAGAFYKPSEDTVYLMHPVTDRDPVERILHEYGHKLWFKHLDHDKRDLWVATWKEVDRFVTPYAAKDPAEDFAECFAYWCLGKLPPADEKRLQMIGIP